jgi:predicted GTPase
MINLLRAQVIVINKVDTARPEDIGTVRDHVRKHNPSAQVIETACRVSVTDPGQVKGKRVLVVEDGPTLTHGEMRYGAGVVCARQFGAAEVIDPRPFAVGSIRRTYEKFPHLSGLLPAMGYSDLQREELKETIRRVPCDLVLVATPIDLARVIEIDRPALRVSYEVEALTRPDFTEVLAGFTAAHKPQASLMEVGR